ncbi:MAG: carboxymuconolactone decarboxylase family protein [Nocardioidaceae bacterium]
MAFIDTITDADADEETAAMYRSEWERMGYVPNYTRIFGARPDVYAAGRSLATAIGSGMDNRRYELVTLAAARQLRSTYCALAHGSILRERFFDGDEVVKIATDVEQSSLDEKDRAIMAYAATVAADAGDVDQHLVDELRSHGMSDQEILDITLAAAARCFFSTVLDALGVEADATYRETVEPEL